MLLRSRELESPGLAGVNRRDGQRLQQGIRSPSSGMGSTGLERRYGDVVEVGCTERPKRCLWYTLLEGSEVSIDIGERSR